MFGLRDDDLGRGDGDDAGQHSRDVVQARQLDGLEDAQGEQRREGQEDPAVFPWDELAACWGTESDDSAQGDEEEGGAKTDPD